MKIIINADDFGVSVNTNDSILRLHRSGIVTSTTLIAGGRSFEDAVGRLEEHPNLGVGVHLCIDGDYNIGNDYRTIIDPETGNFFNFVKIKSRLRKFSLNEREIQREFSLQIEKVRDYGITISHLDSHHNVHIYPQILKSIITVAKRYNIPCVRTLKIIQRRKQSLCNSLYRSALHMILKNTVKVTDGLYEPGLRSGDGIDEAYKRFSALLAKNKSTIEIKIHPRHQCDIESFFFSSQRVRQLLEHHNLVNYNDLH
jgi:chitin disaccharide deacetylase